MKTIIDKNTLRELKSGFPLHEYVRKTYPDIQFNGVSDWIGLCPFHSETTPSFRVNNERYHCFGCHVHGDIIEWMKKVEGIGFEEAIQLLNREKKILTKIYRVTDDIKISPYEARKAMRIMEINEVAQRYFTLLPASLPQYFQERINPKSQFQFGIGYAPDQGVRFIDYMQKNKVTDDELLASSLAAIDSRGNIYARLRDRITIPLKNRVGAILGFAGRLIPRKGNESLPKYLTPPNTAAFNKKRFLFGLDQLNDSRKVILVEGQFDCISMYYHEAKNILSLMGCSISKEQVNLLEYYADKVFTMLDGDIPGLEATFQMTKSLWDAKFSTKNILLSNNLDPDVAATKGKPFLKSLPIVDIEDYYTNKLMVKVPIEYDRTLLDSMIQPWVNDNVKSGFPHYNVVDWVMSAYPKYAVEIKDATLKMLNDYIELPNGKRGLKEENIKAFIKAWIKPSRDVRRAYENKQ